MFWVWGTTFLDKFSLLVNIPEAAPIMCIPGTLKLLQNCRSQPFGFRRCQGYAEGDRNSLGQYDLPSSRVKVENYRTNQPIFFAQENNKFEGRAETHLDTTVARICRRASPARPYSIPISITRTLTAKETTERCSSSLASIRQAHSTTKVSPPSAPVGSTLLSPLWSCPCSA